MANKTNSLAHTKWMCKYHIVFTPKYRRKAIYNQYKSSMREILKHLCRYKGVENSRRTSDAGPHTHACEYSAKDKRIKFYGIPKRQKRTNDVSISMQI